MAHWLWLQLAKGKSVARGSPGAETCAWALAPRFLYLEFLKRRFIAARISGSLGRLLLSGRGLPLFPCSRGLWTAGPPT